ncbi:MAG TPA: PASTA domain-containing protein [bacterium]|nr:PASTA domain-containing protein [bacterium]
MTWLENRFQLPPEERKLTLRALRLLGLFTLVMFLAASAAKLYTQFHQPLIVPKVIGMDQSQAQSALSAKGLTAKVIKSIYDEHVPKGLVCFQNPKANSYMKRGQAVELVLSKGNPMVKVPALSGMSLPQAVIALAGAHLRLGKESLMNSPEARDQVLGQYPAPGEVVDSYTNVNALVSNGIPDPAYVMPNLEKKPLERAFKILRPAGIIIDKITTEVHDDMETEIILSQTPAPGTKVQRKGMVSFVISGKSDAGTPRYAKVAFDMPEGSPKRLQIDILDISGTRTIYNRMESPKDHVELGVSVKGKASAQIYLNQEFVKEIPIE